VRIETSAHAPVADATSFVIRVRPEFTEHSD
jgi:hypothetical protein